MTVLLNGRFREYLESETRMSRVEIRNARRTIRNLALKHSRVEEVDRSSLSEFGRAALESFVNFRIREENFEDRIGLKVDGRSGRVA